MMKTKMLFTLAALPLAIWAKTSTPEGFTDNLDEALAEAKASGKYVYACFSGSDWCGWCRRLEGEVFAKSEFLNGVTNDFLLVFIDRPQDQSLLSDRAKVENPKLIEKYRIEGYPSALVFDETGEVVARTGYQRGGAAKYAKHLLKIRTRGPALKVAEKVLAPFREKVDRIGDASRAEVMAWVEAEVAKGRKRSEVMDEAFSPAHTFVPEMIAKVRAAIAELEAASVPAEAEELLKEELAQAREWINGVEREFNKKAK